MMSIMWAHKIESAQAEAGTWEPLILPNALLAHGYHNHQLLNQCSGNNIKGSCGWRWVGGRVEDNSLGPLGALYSWVMSFLNFLFSGITRNTVFLSWIWEKTTNHKDNLRVIPVQKRKSFSLWQINEDTKEIHNYSKTRDRDDTCIPKRILCSAMAIRTLASVSQKRSKEYVCVWVQFMEHLPQPSCRFRELCGIGRVSQAEPMLWSSGSSDICSCHLCIHTLIAKLLALPRTTGPPVSSAMHPNRAKMNAYWERPVSLTHSERQSVSQIIK